MKNKIYSSIVVAGMATVLVGCSDNSVMAEQKDWNNTTLFLSADVASQDTYYKPSVGYVGDPMPFYDPKARDFKILYLQDYRPNEAGTYHPIWGVSTKDAANYSSMGELISFGGIEEQDAAIGTGCTVYNDADGMYYTFYTGGKYRPTANDNAQAVMMATSSDMKIWKKDRTFFLKGDKYGYSKDEFRDPFVFKGDDDRWHMLVATMKGNKGHLAEFVSSNLKQWESAGTFMTMMWDRFYECPDVFKMGDWWYLVYSEKHSAIRKIQYFKGRTIEELKACTLNDAGRWPDAHEGFLDGRGLYAGKTASDGSNRYLWAWCPTRAGKENTNVGAAPNEPEWAGNLVAHKVIQHEDGSLTLGEIPAVSKKYKVDSEVRVMEQSKEGVQVSAGEYSLKGEAYVLFNRLGRHNKIAFTVTTTNHWDKFGISLVRSSDVSKYYTMVLNPEKENVRKINFEEEGTGGKGFIAGIDSYPFPTPQDGVYNIRIYTDNSVCVMYVNDVCCYTNRIYGIQRNCWSINSYGGNIKVSNLSVSEY